MKFLVNWLCIYALIFSPLAQAQTTATIVTATDSVGIRTVENLLKNPGVEVSLKDITASGGTLTRITGAASRSGYGASWDSNAAAQTLTFSGRQIKVTQNGYAYIWLKVPSGTSTHKLQLYNGSVVVAEVSVTSSTSFLRHEIYAPLYAGTTLDLRLLSVASNEPEIYADDGFIGEAFGITNVSQASLFGTAYQAGATGCSYDESSSTALNNFVTLGSGSGCNAWTTTGSVGVTGTNSHSITIAQMPPGEYKFELNGYFDNAGGSLSQSCIFRIIDGASGLGDITWNFTNGLTYTTPHNYIAGNYTVSTPLTNKTFSVQAADDNTAACKLNNGTSNASIKWRVWKYPTTSDIVTANTLDSLGSVFYVANSTCPSGSLPADGSAVSRTTYGPLFNRIGTTHGVGDGSTTFNLPDLRGIFVRGTGSQSISGQSFSGTLAAKQVDGFESHTHTQNSHNHTQDSHNHTQNAHDHTFTINGLSGQGTIYGDGGANTGDYDRYANGGNGIYGSIDLDTATATNNATTATNQATTATNQNTGGSETSPANISLTPCISYATTAAPIFVGGIPTQQKFPSGSGTYTTPAGVKYLKVRMVGGGGGGGATNNSGTGGTGGTTTFGTSLLTAGGGSGASYIGGSGSGTATINSPAYGTGIAGGNGTDGLYPGTLPANAQFTGGHGGVNPLGGSSRGSSQGSGNNGVANTGAGGSGGMTQATNKYAGGGGGAGAYIEAIIPNPLGSYSYAVGAGGTAGNDGGAENDGGNGGSGYIEVTEYYQ